MIASSGLMVVDSHLLFDLGPVTVLLNTSVQ